MKKQNSPIVLPLGRSLLAFLISALPLAAANLVDPILVTGTNAIDPYLVSGTQSGTQKVDQNAAGSNGASQGALEALPEFGAIQNFAGWNNQSTPGYIVFTSGNRADVKGTYENLTGSTAGGATTSVGHQTSDGKGIKINTGSTKNTSLVLDFGSYSESGTSVTFDSLGQSTSAAGMTISGLANTSTNVVITYYGTDDVEVLYSGTLSSGSDPNPEDSGSTYGSDGYVGFLATGTGTKSAIGKIRLVANQLIGSSPGIGVDDFGYTASGKSYYMSPTGAGSFSGSNLANALPQSQMATTLNVTMLAGDTLYLASGSYNTAMNITTSGAANAWKRVVGLGSGTNPTLFAGAKWDAAFPTGNSEPLNGEVFTPSNCFIKLQGVGNSGVAYWEFRNLEISKAKYGALSEIRTAPDHHDIRFRDIKIYDVRYGMFFRHCDLLDIENTSVVRYTKYAYCLDYGCDDIDFINCLANLTGNDDDDHDDPAYQTAENIPFGFVSAASGTMPNSNLKFTNCVAKNNRDFTPGNPEFFNGDGFVTEVSTWGATFVNCIAINNDDAGFDCKLPVSGTYAMNYDNCKAIGNSNGFKSWNSAHNYNNCAAVYGKRRETGTNGVAYSGTLKNDVAGFSSKNATINILHCTTLANGADSTRPLVQQGAGVRLYASGSVQVTDSIIAFDGPEGAFTETKDLVAPGSGVITLVNSATCRPNLPGWPNFGDSPAVIRAWKGLGTTMDSSTYGLTKGYNSTRP